MRIAFLFLFFAVFLKISATNLDTTKILFLHPTVNNIETFIFLHDNKLIDIENVKFVGVYFEKEAYDYTESVNFLRDTLISYISLDKVKGVLEENNVYKQNNLTAKFDSLFSISKGAIFMGGPDISPSVYGNKTNLITEITDPYRHFFEISFLFHLLGNNKNEITPLLEKNTNYVVWAFCLGMQSINVATGGTLYQDIPSEIYGLKYVEDVLAKPELMHKNYFKNLTPNDSVFGGFLHKIQTVSNEKNNILKSIGNNLTPTVLSWHHQAVKDLGNNLKVLFTSYDGKIVEGFTHKTFKNVYGFQFHPEYTKLYRTDFIIKEFPNSEPKSLNSVLVETNSFQFHKGLWSYFSELFK